MTDTTQTLRDDIAFIRALAEQGRRGAGGGGLMMSAGLIYGAASLYHWSVAAHLWRPPGDYQGVSWVWLGASGLFLANVVVARVRNPRRVGANVAATAWASMGAAIWTLCIGIGLSAWRLHDPNLMYMIAPMVLALYAGGWAVASVVYGKAWVRGMGWAALASSLLIAALAGRPEQFLAFAVALAVFAAIPGYLFMRSGRDAA